MLVRTIYNPRTHGAPDGKRDQQKESVTNKQKNKHHIFAPAADAHCAIFPKLCTVIELVVPIIKGVSHFFGSNAQFFLQGARKNLA